MSKMQYLTAAALWALTPFAVAVADQPPEGVKPLAEIVEQLEQQGYGPFVEISYDNGSWEVEVVKGDASYELAVDPRTGKVLAEHPDDAEPRPPHDARPLSWTLRKLEDAGYTGVSEISFERRYWEMELHRTDGKHEILVDPKTADIINERHDD